MEFVGWNWAPHDEGDLRHLFWTERFFPRSYLRRTYSRNSRTWDCGYLTFCIPYLTHGHEVGRRDDLETIGYLLI